MRLFSRFIKRKPPEIAIDKRELVKLLSSDAVIMEAGVCDGQDTEEFAKCFPAGTIHGFECLPHYYEFAKKKLQGYSNVNLYPLALNNVTCELDFHVSTLGGDFYGSGSILKPKQHTEIHPQIVFNDTIRVQAISIDDWCAKYNIQRIDFLWFDLQGAEVKALRGATKALDNVRGIFAEVSLIETYEDVPLYGEIKSFLESKSFRVEREYLPYKDMGNVLFVRK